MSAGIGPMKKSIEHWVAPALRKRGFIGKFPVLRRKRGTQLDIVELQFNKYGGSFRLNLGTCPAEGITTRWGQFVQPEEVTTSHEMARRYFLTPFQLSEGRTSARWFEFAKENTDEVAQAFLANIDVMDRWFITGDAPRAKARPKSRGGPIHRFVMRLLSP
jgi:hypothetical protein